MRKTCSFLTDLSGIEVHNHFFNLKGYLSVIYLMSKSVCNSAYIGILCTLFTVIYVIRHLYCTRKISSLL